MKIKAKTWKAPDAAVASNWFQAVEDSTLDDRMDDLLGDTFIDFTSEHEITYQREANTFSLVYEVPSVWPIRGAA